MQYENENTAHSRYSACQLDRTLFLDRARESSELTLPTLFPPDGNSSASDYPTPYNSIGARAVNNLASKLLLALIPPNAPFFRLKIDDFVLKEMEGDENLKTELEKGLSQVEKAVMTNIETGADRVAIFEALKLLIVGGNCLLFVGEEGVRVFSLDRYVVKRDPMGNVLEIITKESLAYNSLDLEIQELIQEEYKSDEKNCELYTHIKREKDKYYVYQEIHGKVIPKSQGVFALDKSPYIPLRWNRIDSENYGRGFVEEYIGDLKSLEALTRAIVEGSASASKMLFMVSPNGTTRAHKLANSRNGAIIEGSANDVTVLQANKFQDFRVAQETIQRIEQRLQQAFMLNSSVTRQAERVTSTEINFLASELEDSLGGVYSILSMEFQLPFIARKIAMMEKKKKLPKIQKGLIFPSIVTGLEALGRGNDRNKLISFLTTLGNVLGGETIMKYVNVSDAITRLATAEGIDPDGLIKSDEEMQAELQQQQMQQMAQNVNPNQVQEMVGQVQDQMQQQ
jgi:hypothetical protein